jgi:acyl carrier protein
MDALLTELRDLIVNTLDLADVNPQTIDPDAPLFDKNAGLGLDSIDALELAVAVSKRYGVALRAEDEETTRAFGSLRALAAHISSLQGGAELAH